MAAIDDLPAVITTEEAEVWTYSDGTGSSWNARKVQVEALYNLREGNGDLDWTVVLQRDFYRMAIEVDAADLKPALLKLAARACIWVDQIDARVQ